MDLLKALVEKKMKEGSHDQDMDPNYKTAKMGVLKEISDMAGKAMGEDIEDLHQNKVSVSAPDRMGLELGLKKAEELVSQEGEPLHSNDMDEEEHHGPGMEEGHNEMAEEESPEEEASESPEDEEEEDEEDKHSY